MHALLPEPLPDSQLTPHISTAPRVYTPVAGHAGLAHDAGNLLGALHLYCDLLGMSGVLAPEHKHYAADLSLIAARSSELIQRLLRSATAANAEGQADGGQSETVGAEVASTARQPAAALRALAPVLKRIAAGAAHVSVHIPAPLPAVALPAEALERITVNLVRNAAEAIRSARRGSAGSQLLTQLGSSQGQIRIALEQSGNALRLTVEDNGPGMPPAVAAAFLRPSPLPEGAVRGLGHRIVHELATETGATLSIRVRPGRGTVFSLRWPLPDGPAQHAPTQPMQTLEPLHRDGPSPHGPGGLTPC